MLFPIIIALLAACTVTYLIFKSKKNEDVKPPVTTIEESIEEVGYESASPIVFEETPKKARKPRAKKDA